MEYISSANSEKVKAIYTLLEADINPDWDEALEMELTRRSDEFKKGEAKTYTWEETKAAAIASRTK